MSQQLEKTRSNATAIRDLLEKQKSQIALALPKHITADRMLRVVMTSIQRNPKLLECEQFSLLGAVMMSAQLGLECDGVMGQAYLIPYWNTKNRRLEAQFQPGYKGLLSLARRSGEIARVETKVVCQKDTFSYQFGLHADLKFIPGQEADRGDPTHVYALVLLKDGSPYFDVWTVGQIEKHRAQYSKASDNGPWVTAWSEMAKKTVLKAVLKLCPTSVEYQVAHALDDQAESGLPQDLELNIPAEVIEAEKVEPKTKLDRIVQEEEIKKSVDPNFAQPESSTEEPKTEEYACSDILYNQLVDTIENAKQVGLTQAKINSTIKIYTGPTRTKEQLKDDEVTALIKSIADAAEKVGK